MTDVGRMVELIDRKKSGERLSYDELAWICTGYLSGEVPDYQVAAWLMAVCWRGMTQGETLALTRAMVESGETLSWPTDRPVVDKHSTGGVGDKTSIALVPLLAAAGYTFVKMSGRGLAHTGGTIDKLESIPGFQTALPRDRLRAQVARIGCALVSQNKGLVPADGKLYALRDVTATVDSLPLIASSIMAKKLAGGAGSIVLDVKFGSGALLPDGRDAEALARAMIDIGVGSGRRIAALLSSMEEPLGRAVGNALEVAEAIELLRGGGPIDLRELTLALGKQLILLAEGGDEVSGAEARRRLEDLLASGAAAEKLEELIAAQGGEPGVVARPELLPAAPRRVYIESAEAGWVAGVDAREVARAVLELGGGRRRKEDSIDPRTGVRLLARTGDRIERGQPLAELHVDGVDEERRARSILSNAYHFSDEPVTIAATKYRSLHS